MDEKPDSNRPIESPQPGAAGGGDPVSDWASEALKDVHHAANQEAIFLERKSAYLEWLDKEIAGMSAADARRTVESCLDGETDPEMRRHLEHMAAALEHRETEERERESAWRGRFTVKWLVTAGSVALVISVIILATVLAATGELSCAPDEPASNSPGVNSGAPTTEQPAPERGPQSAASSDPYLEARAALGLSTTTPATVEHMNTGTGPMLYELSWADGVEAPRVKLGSIGVITLTQDRAMEEGGRATLGGSDSTGAYVVGKEAGQVNISVRIAIRVPGPDGGEPRLTVFTLENTEGSTLVGTARPHEGEEPEPPWYVVGERQATK